MSLQDIKDAAKIVVGAKQTTKALERGEALTVYIAKNADNHVVSPVYSLCEEKSVPLVYVEDMNELGRASGIKVGAAMVAVLER